MKTEKTTTPAIRLENGDIIIGIHQHGRYGKEYYVLIGEEEIVVYCEDEMLEVYGVAPKTLT